VTVYDGTSDQFPVLGRFSGQTAPSGPLYASGPHLVVIFTSDDLNNGATFGFTGFSAQIVRLAALPPTSTQSPGFPPSPLAPLSTMAPAPGANVCSQTIPLVLAKRGSSGVIWVSGTPQAPVRGAVN
jgi:hypothetical protein